MRISCIIPTRNRRETVPAAIDSVRRQNFSSLEIILVDDGSTDTTAAEVRSLFPEVKILKLAGLGPGPARNAGVAAARGDIIMFLDSDDLWLPGHVQRLVDTLDRGYEVAYGVARTHSEIDHSVFLIPEDGAGVEGDCFEYLTRWCFMVPSAVALTHRAFSRAGGFPAQKCGEDWLFFLRLASIYPFGFAGPEPVTLRTLHPLSLCFLQDRKKLLDIIRQVLIFLENEPRATAAHHERFTLLYNWTAENVSQWTTVQDWYLSLREENLI